MIDPDPMIVTLRVSELRRLVADEVEARVRALMPAPGEAEEYFNGLKELAHYLQASVSYAAKIERMLPPGASYRAGKMIKVKRSAVDELIKEGKIR